MRIGVPSPSTSRSSGLVTKPSGSPRSGVFGLAAVLAGRLVGRRRAPWIGRLEAEAARNVDGAEQQLQQVQRAAGLEAVRVGRDAAHRMHRDRPPAHRLVAPAGPVGPRHGNLDRLLERDVRELGGDAADRVRRERRSVSATASGE